MSKRGIVVALAPVALVWAAATFVHCGSGSTSTMNDESDTGLEIPTGHSADGSDDGIGALISGDVDRTGPQAPDASTSGVPSCGSWQTYDAGTDACERTQDDPRNCGTCGVRSEEHTSELQ